jgi:hypothetical protein
LDALRSIAQVQAVSQAGVLSALSDLGAGAVSADEVSLLYTGDALSQAVALAPVGDITGTDRRPGVFEVSTISAVVTEGGRSIQPFIVARHDGAYGAVRLQVRLQGDAQLLVTNAITVDFPDAVTQQVVDLSPALRDDADPRPDRWITASLILASDAPIGASLGSITRGEIRVLDDDSAGSIGFTSNRFEGTEGSEVALELRRVDGTAGRIVALVRLLGGTATVGQDYLGAVLTVEFLPGQTRKVVKLDWVDDSVVEGKESVNATLEIGTGSAVGSGLMVQGASTVIEVGDDDLPPASNSAPVATGVAPGASLTVMAGTSTQLTLQGYDAENSPLSFLRVTAPTKGVLTGQAPNLVYTANLGAVGTDRARAEGQRRDMPLADRAQTQDEAARARPAFRLVGMQHDARVEKCRSLERIFVQEKRADEPPLRFGKDSVIGERIFHLIGARFEQIDEIAMALVEIRQYVEKLAFRLVIGQRYDAIDNMVCARLVGRR